MGFTPTCVHGIGDYARAPIVERPMLLAAGLALQPREKSHLTSMAIICSYHSYGM
jgi:hypothetical protein